MTNPGNFPLSDYTEKTPQAPTSISYTIEGKASDITTDVNVLLVAPLLKGMVGSQISPEFAQGQLKATCNFDLPLSRSYAQEKGLKLKSIEVNPLNEGKFFSQAAKEIEIGTINQLGVVTLKKIKAQPFIAEPEAKLVYLVDEIVDKFTQVSYTIVANNSVEITEVWE